MQGHKPSGKRPGAGLWVVADVVVIAVLLTLVVIAGANRLTAQDRVPATEATGASTTLR
jgi:hypothetical protein